MPEDNLGIIPKSAPNGVTRLVRRFMSLCSALTFFGLIAGEFFLKIVDKDVPFFLYALLASIAVVAHDRFEETLKMVLGMKK